MLYLRKLNSKLISSQVPRELMTANFTDITATPAIEDSPATDPGPGSRWASIPDSLTTDTGPGSRWASVDTHQIIPPIPGK